MFINSYALIPTKQKRVISSFKKLPEVIPLQSASLNLDLLLQGETVKTGDLREHSMKLLPGPVQRWEDLDHIPL